MKCGSHLLLQTAVLFVRPRGWHLLEKHMHVDGQPVPAAIFDFALYFFHNAKELLRRHSGARQECRSKASGLSLSMSRPEHIGMPACAPPYVPLQIELQRCTR